MLEVSFLRIPSAEESNQIRYTADILARVAVRLKTTPEGIEVAVAKLLEECLQLQEKRLEGGER